MKVRTAFSEAGDINAIIADIKKQIGTFDTRLLLFFASPSIDPDQISSLIRHGFPDVPTFGCSSSGEIISGGVLDKSIVAMAFGPEIITDCTIEVLENIKSDKGQVENAFSAFGKYFNCPAADLPSDEYVGIVLIDGLSMQEERINERIGDLTNVTFIGGSAGDDLAFKQTYVYANGKTLSDAAVLVLIKSSTKFDFLKTQSFRATDKKLVVTKADESVRKVMEINNRPATEVYASAAGVPEKAVADAFFTHPVGLVFEDDFFVRSPQKTEGKSIYFYCSIKEGMELSLLESLDIVKMTREALDRKAKEMEEISAIINFNCILRTLELKNKKQTRAYGDIFKSIPTIGFSTYGESYIGHINQTATMLLFK
jgi:hypothetical protein